MGIRKVQQSFVAGELSPSMYGRFDDQKFAQGLSKCRNFIVLPQGPVVLRPGTAYVNAAKFSDKPSRLIPFTFSSEDTTVLEFGEKYIRFHTRGQTLMSDDGETPYEVETPYSADDVKDIHYCQSMDVMTLVHPSYPPRELRRYAATDWRLAEVAFGAPLPAPTAPSCSYTVVASNGQTLTTEEKTRYDLKYRITAVRDSDDGVEESEASAVGQTKGNLYLNNALVTLTWSAVNGADRYRVYKNFKGLYCYIGETAETRFEDDNYDPDAGIVPPIYEDPFGQDSGVSSVTVTDGGAGYQAIRSVDEILDAFKAAEGSHVRAVSEGGFAKKFYRVVSKQKGSLKFSFTRRPQFFTGGPFESLSEAQFEPRNSYEFVDAEGSGASVLFSFVMEGTYFGSQPSDTPWVDGVKGGRLVTTTFRLDRVFMNGGGQGYVSPEFQIKETCLRLNSVFRWHTTEGVERYTALSEDVEVWRFFPESLKVPTAYKPHAYVYEPSGKGNGALLETECHGGAVTNIHIRAAGSGYKSGVVVIVGGGGVGAKATLTIGKTGDFPAAVCYFEQRRCFAGTPVRPQTVWMSRSGTESNFSYTIPSKDDNRLKFRIAAQEASRIQHLVAISNILALTNSTEYRISSGESGPMSPSAIDSKAQSQIGANNVQPVIVNTTVVYAAKRGGHVREIGYNWQAGGYVTGDLSIRAPHLFENNEVVGMGLAKSPDPIVWCVMKSGDLLGMTYMPEQGILAWHRHDTRGGAFESVTVVPEGDEDIPYVIVRRRIGGKTVRYVERMHERAFLNLEGAFHVDAGGVYDGGPTGAVTGLTWLEGETVSILADGCVLPKGVVKDGVVDLGGEFYRHVVVGLPIEADFQTLPAALQITDGSYGNGHAKNVNEVFIRVVNSSGILVGTDFNDLTEVKQRTDEPYGTPPRLMTKEVSVVPSPNWGESGQVCIRQSDPLPLTITSITYDMAS